MATAVFLSHPTHGHLMPARGVIAELVRRGERVIVYATERGHAAIQATGADVVLYPADHDAFDPTPPTAGLFSDMARLAELCARIVPQLVDDVRRHGADYLLLDSKSLWGRMVAQITRLPAVKLSVVFAVPHTIDAGELVPMLYSGASAEVLLDGLLAFSRYTGIAMPLDRALGTVSPGIAEFLGNPQACNIHFTSRAFQPAGNAFGDDTYFTGPWVVPNRDDAADFPFELLDERPLVYISLGTTFHDAPAFYDACYRAFATSPWRIVLSTGGATIDEPPPPNFIVSPSVPQLPVLAHASAVITHGGMNTVNEALWFGVPMLVYPQRGDQHLVASRVEELGAGLRATEITPLTLRRSVARLLDEPGFRASASRLGRTLHEAGGAVRAADVILSFVSSREVTA